MTVIAGDWINSEYISIDENGWHCADDAPEDIKKAFNEFMEAVNDEPKIIE